MSTFGAKRKARKITVQEDDEDDNSARSSSGIASPPTASEPEQEPPLLQATFKSRKPFKQSSLRKSINTNEGRGTLGSSIGDNASSAGDTREEEEEDTGSPVVRRPQLGRSGSTKSKKRQSSSSRLSFGPGGLGSGDGDEDGDSILLGEPVFTPKKPISGLVQTASENSAIKKGMARNNLLPGLNRLAMRSADNGGDDDEGRPRYSKEYLSELQNSTPNTPQNIKSMHVATPEDDEMSLDPSELEGAMIIDTTGSSGSAVAAEIPQTAVLSEAEIREKKERRARLAKQQSAAGDDFISLSDDGDDSTTRRGAGESYLTVLSRQSHPSSSSSSRKKKESRLVPEDEDLGEGFDSFVEDAGGLSLSRKAEREARRKQRAAMASMIQTAEGGDNEDGSESDDSEAERRAAYEKAQTRAGMDGLKRKDTATSRGNAQQQQQLPPPKITPLPDLSVLVADFKAKMARKEAELQRMRARIDELRAERDGVLAREPEVQKLLDEAGERYKALTAPASGGNSAEAGTVEEDADGKSVGATTGEGSEAQPGVGGIVAAQSLLNRARGGDTSLGGARGLDSLGTTPTRQPPVEMEF